MTRMSTVIKMNAINWEWKIVNDELVPIMSDVNAADVHSITKKLTHQEGVVRFRRKLVDKKIIYRIVND